MEHRVQLADVVGIPYLDHGRSNKGWDCYGLVCWMLQHEFGLRVPSYTMSYTKADDLESSGSAFEYHKGEWVHVERGTEQYGDVIVLTLGGSPVHCGMVLEPGRMLHCLAGRETCVERYDGHAWANRIEGIYRWK